MNSLPINSIQNFSIFSWAWKHKIFIVFLIFTLPLVISSIVISIQEKNYSKPYIDLTLSVINADYIIGKNVGILETSPEILVGMKHPDVGIYQHTKYFWLFFWKVIWKFLTELFMIIIPFTLFYFIFNLINNSTRLKNLILSGILGISFIFIINLLITIINLANGSLILTLQGNEFSQILQVIFKTIPFHGTISLVIYLIEIFL